MPRARIKDYEDQPEWFKCCETKRNLIRKDSGKIIEVGEAVGKLTGHCNFCGANLGERLIIKAKCDFDPKMNAYAVECIDIEEGV